MLIYNLQKSGEKMNPCEFNMAVSSLACAIAKNKNSNEIALLSAFFTQLGDCLETIQAVKICNENQNVQTDENGTI